MMGKLPKKVSVQEGEIKFSCKAVRRIVYIQC